MKLVGSAFICAVVLYWLDATYFNGTYFNAFYAIISQLLTHRGAPLSAAAKFAPVCRALFCTWASRLSAKCARWSADGRFQAEADISRQAKLTNLVEIDPGCVKTLPTVVGAQQKIKPAALAIFSCPNGILLKSILRQSDVRRRFHTAKTQLRHWQFFDKPCPSSRLSRFGMAFWLVTKCARAAKSEKFHARSKKRSPYKSAGPD